MTQKTLLAFIPLGLLGACGDNYGDDPCKQSGVACVFAGTGERGYNNDHLNAHRLESKLYFPSDITFDSQNRAYISDWNNHKIRRVETNDSLVDVVGTDYEGDGPPEMEDRLPLCAPPGAPGTKIAMNHMTEAKFGPDGKLYIAAWHNNKVRVYDPATDIVISEAGDGYGYGGDGTAACNAIFNQPKAITFGPDGAQYIIDQRNVRIRKIDPVTGMITTWAGVGTLGNGGDGGLANDAEFGFETGTTPRPSGAMVIDGGFMYVADSLNNRIRRISMTTGMIDCIAGSSEAGYSGDGANALQARFNFPADLEIGPDHRLYVADRGNNVIRAIDLATGIVETVAGTGEQCDTLYDDCGDRVLANELRLNEPYGIAFDNNGDLYVNDTHNNRIFKVAK
jgi:NHL repeat